MRDFSVDNHAETGFKKRRFTIYSWRSYPSAKLVLSAVLVLKYSLYLDRSYAPVCYSLFPPRTLRVPTLVCEADASLLLFPLFLAPTSDSSSHDSHL